MKDYIQFLAPQITYRQMAALLAALEGDENQEHAHEVILSYYSYSPIVRHGKNLHKQVVNSQISLAVEAIKSPQKLQRLILMKQVTSRQFAGH